MHRLDRSKLRPPACLNGYDYRTRTWDDLDQKCKRELRAALLQMQGNPNIATPEADRCGLRCAYCESAIREGGHIEHFRRKSEKHYPQFTFFWGNLFLSCDDRGHCGHYKDRGSAPSYDPDQLIKPDQNDPEHFLYFHSKGEVRPRPALGVNDTRRAEETIRVFGLNDSRLQGRRAKAVEKLRKTILDDLDELGSWAKEDRHAYLTQEIEANRYQPYVTTIKHFLQSNA